MIYRRGKNDIYWYRFRICPLAVTGIRAHSSGR